MYCCGIRVYYCAQVSILARAQKQQLHLLKKEDLARHQLVRLHYLALHYMTLQIAVCSIWRYSQCFMQSCQNRAHRVVQIAERTVTIFISAKHNHLDYLAVVCLQVCIVTACVVYALLYTHRSPRVSVQQQQDPQ
jgi:hypothetical protein